MKGNIDPNKKIVDEKVIVEISQDKMLGVVSFLPPENGGKEITLGELKKSITDAKVVSGVNQDLLESLIRERKHNFKYPIAQGKPPIHGKDGTLELFFEIKSNEESVLRPKENEDGSVDFKNLDLIQTVSKDQKLAQITPPTIGESGENVLGREIKPNRGRVKRLPRGKNVYLSDDELILYSSIEGQLTYNYDRINIEETYVVEGNAGVATGNIDFVGNVLVRGNVEPGFIVKAGGNVEVQGFVGESTIIAGNDILLRHGIQGKNTGKLMAQGDIVAKFIQNSIVKTEGSLYTEAIMHSQVEVGDSVVVEVNKGLIVGGTVQATKLISAKIIGSPMNTTTNIKICRGLTLQEEYNAAQKDLVTKRKQLSQVDKNIAFVHEKLAKGEKLPKARLESIKTMLQLQKQLRAEISETQKKFDTLSASLNDCRAGVIQVSDVMYPGTRITMGSSVKHIRDEVKYARMHIVDNDIKTDPFS